MPNEAHAQASAQVIASMCQGTVQILRTVVFAVSRPGGECSTGACDAMVAMACTGAATGASCARHTRGRSVAGAAATICGASSVRSSVRQQPIFVISPHCPCMERQQALSSWLIAAPATQASTGVTAVSRRKIATMPERRRISCLQYNLGATPRAAPPPRSPAQHASQAPPMQSPPQPELLQQPR